MIVDGRGEKVKYGNMSVSCCIILFVDRITSRVGGRVMNGQLAAAMVAVLVTKV